MKKKHLITTSAALAAALAVSPVLASCTGDRYTEIKFAKQDTSYAVTSQGGSAVAYGNYVYFINGSRGYDDTDGNANVWNKVVKGGLYRAEFNGARDVDNDKLFKPAFDSADGLEFKYENGKDYFDKAIKVVDTTVIAPKTIGTSGYGKGGIFIYDNNVYFASPNNEKSKTGTVQSTRTDFFMMPLSGGKPTRIYTTSEKVDTSSSAYAFYKYGDSVYLVVNEGENIVSIGINAAKAKANDPVAFKVGATSVCFPVRDMYYTGISTDTPEDFIYFVRAVKEADSQKSGTVIEAMRPDGSENFVVSMTGATETIECVRDGLVFIKTTEAGKSYIKYTNMHKMLMGDESGDGAVSPSYKKAQDEKNDGERNVDVTGKFPSEITSSITATYPFRADKRSNEVFFVGATSSGFTLYQNNVNEPVRIGSLCTTTGTPQFIANNYLYFSGSNSDYYRVPLFANMDGSGTAKSIAEKTSTATFGCDYASGYFTYFAEVDQWATGYAYFVKLDGQEGAEPQFVGSRASGDTPTEEQLEAIKNGSSSGSEAN